MSKELLHCIFISFDDSTSKSFLKILIYGCNKNNCSSQITKTKMDKLCLQASLWKRVVEKGCTLQCKVNVSELYFNAIFPKAKYLAI